MKKSPQSHYQAEKAKRQHGMPHDHLLQEAKREYQRMLADSQQSRKGGRPKKPKSA